MKKIKVLFIAVLAILAAATPASAQFRWGVKIGADVNKMSFSNTSFLTNSSNRSGFTGGLMAEFTVPLINLCFDASVMYTHKSNKAFVTPESGSQQELKFGTDYLSIPINLKYKFGLPVVGRIISPYIFTGPEFYALLSKKAIGEFVHNRKAEVAWNLGFGLQLLNHLQLSAGYGWGVKNAMTIKDGVNSKTAKTNAWTVTAAYLF